MPARLPVINVWWSMPARKQPVGRRQQVDVGAGEGVLPFAGEPGARRHHAGAPVGPPVDAHGSRRRSARRGRTGRAGGGTWSSARACGCRRRTAPRRPARRPPRQPASLRSRCVTGSPGVGAPAKPRSVSFHARHCIPSRRSFAGPDAFALPRSLARGRRAGSSSTMICYRGAMFFRAAARSRPRPSRLLVLSGMLRRARRRTSRRSARRRWCRSRASRRATSRSRCARPSICAR